MRNAQRDNYSVASPESKWLIVRINIGASELISMTAENFMGWLYNSLSDLKCKDVKVRRKYIEAWWRNTFALNNRVLWSNFEHDFEKGWFQEENVKI